jgi:hypothetical protein
MPDTHRFFGYGSLVNRATQTYPNAQPAALAGWRRVWRRTTLREVAFLSVRPDPGCQIEGLVADVPGGDWAALDQRETGYAKHSVVTSAGAVQVYAVAPEKLAPDQQVTVLLSYLDVVVQGFLKEFGEAGVARFFETTEGWGGVQDDRDAPLYPRAQVLSTQERGLVDHWLARVV